MARKKKQKGPAKPHKKFVAGSPQEFAEHQKRVEATKKRKRAPKGTPWGGHFAPGSQPKPGVKQYRPEGFKAEGRSGRDPDYVPPGGKVPRLKRQAPGGAPIGSRTPAPREMRDMQLDSARRMPRKQLEQAYAHSSARNITGASSVQPQKPEERRVVVTHHDVKRAEMARRESSWQSGKGVFTHEGVAAGKYVTPTQFLTQEAPPGLQKQIQKDMDNPNSWMNKGVKTGTARLKTTDSKGRPAIVGRLSPAQQNRLRIMVKGLQDGKSYNEMKEQFGTERRGRKPTKRAGNVSGSPRETVNRTLDRTTRTGRKGKYDQLTPRPDEIQAGLSGQHVDSIRNLSSQFPDMTDRDIIRLQQGQRETIWSDMMEKNARWAQETRANNITDGKIGAAKNTNRVVFFTTSLGSPAPSVPSDSLIGQYIIRRRKNMLLKEGVAKPRDVQGKFPDIVRDMHIVEASTGVSFGAQGDVGAFRRTGFRVGTKKSPGYGKPVPVGSQILYDSQGRPLYDSQGNIRYSEGATRRFNVTTPDLGFRVFIG